MKNKSIESLLIKKTKCIGIRADRVVCYITIGDILKYLSYSPYGSKLLLCDEKEMRKIIANVINSIGYAMKIGLRV